MGLLHLMRIAYIGNFGAEHSTENHVRIALTTIGHDVHPHPEQGFDWTRLKSKTKGADIILWTRTAGYDPLDLDAQRRALNRLDIPTVGFHLDRWWGLDREPDVFRSPFFDVDLLFTADGGHDAQWQEAGVNHVWSPPAVSAQEAKLGTPRPEYASRVGFVGSWKHYHREWPQRQQLIRWAQRTYGRRFRVWPAAGNPAIRGEPLRDLYASIDVIIGDSCLTGSPARYWSDRIPETLGRGGFLIHPMVEGLEEAYPMLPTVKSEDWSGWKTTVDRFLAEPEERVMIAEAARKHVLAEHTYEVRLAWVVDRIEQEFKL